VVGRVCAALALALALVLCIPALDGFGCSIWLDEPSRLKGELGGETGGVPTPVPAPPIALLLGRSPVVFRPLNPEICELGPGLVTAGAPGGRGDALETAGWGLTEPLTDRLGLLAEEAEVGESVMPEFDGFLR